MLIYEITPEVLHKAMGESAAPTILDVREPAEVQVAPFPGALQVPMGEVPRRAFAELDPDQPVVVVCHHGVRSLHVVDWLRQQGFERAASTPGR